MINMDLMKEKFNRLNDKDNRADGPMNWKPQHGDQDIRIVPTEDGDPFREFWVHYRIGSNRPFLCPKKNSGEDCPVCNFAWELYNEGDTKTAKELLPTQRFASPVVVRGETNEVKVWSYSKRIYEELLSYVMNPEYGDVTDVGGGVDFTLTYDAEAAKNRQLATRITPRRTSSPLDSEDSVVKSILSSVPDLSEKFEKVSSEGVRNIFEVFINGSSASQQSSNGPSSTSSETEVDTAFKELGLS